jgi:hypothetical protein
VVKQNIKVVACGRGYSPHGRQEAERAAERVLGKIKPPKDMFPVIYFLQLSLPPSFQHLPK